MIVQQQQQQQQQGGIEIKANDYENFFQTPKYIRNIFGVRGTS